MTNSVFTGRVYSASCLILLLLYSTLDHCSTQETSERCEKIPTDDEHGCNDVLSTDYYVLRNLVFIADGIRDLQTLINALQQSEKCTLFLRILFCFYNFPPCDFNRSEALPVCPGKCPEIDGLFEECRGVADLPTFQIIPFIGPFIENFNCSNPATYYPDIPSDINYSNSTCNSPKLSGGVIAGAAIGGFGVIIVILGVVLALVIWIKIKRRQKIRLPTREMSKFDHDVVPPPIAKHENDYEVHQLLQTVKDKFSDVLIPTDNITKQNFLGKGAFGVVHKGDLMIADGSTTILVAIKTIASINLSAVRDLVAESTVMKHLDHPNVLPLLGVCVDPDDDDNLFKIILPFMANGDLRSFLKANRVEPTNTEQFSDSINEIVLVNMCLDIAKGMEYLSEKRFVHRDLAARNCMVDEHCSIRVADFGLTKDIYTNEYYRADKHSVLPVKWMALESILDNYFDEKTDVWSYGVTCWEIFSLGRIPYPGVVNQHVAGILRDGSRLCKPVLCPLKLFTLMKTTWLENPAERPSFVDIVTDLNQSKILS